MARVDYGIEEARATMENVASGCDESYIIVAEFPEIDYVLAYRGGKYEPWVAAWGYNGKNCWTQGHYFATINGAMKYIQYLKDKIPYERMDELASKAIDGLFENDPYEAETYCEETLELTDYEREYFGIKDKIEEELEW